MAYARVMRVVFLAVAATTFATVLACSRTESPAVVDAGTPASADAGLDASALPYPLTQTCAAPTDAGNACSQCNQANCCQSREKILPTSLDPLIDCMALCASDGGSKPQDDCQKRCLDGNPDQGIYLAHFACLEHHCSVECGDGGNPCLSCVTAKCPLEALACTTTPECVYMTSCAGECADGDAACTEACYRKHAAAKTVVDNQTFCAQARCATECKRKP